MNSFDRMIAAIDSACPCWWSICRYGRRRRLRQYTSKDFLDAGQKHSVDEERDFIFEVVYGRSNKDSRIAEGKNIKDQAIRTYLKLRDFRHRDVESRHRFRNQAVSDG